MSVSIVVLYLFDQYVPVLTSVYLFRFLCLYKPVLCAIDGGLLFELSYAIVNSKSSLYQSTQINEAELLTYIYAGFVSFVAAVEDLHWR